MIFQRLPVALLMLPACLLSGPRTFEKIECRDVPAPVRAAAAKQKTKSGTEASCEKIADNGATLYEFKVTTDTGKMREIVFQPNGEIAEFEEESELAAIPLAARAAIEKTVASGELRKVDIIHRGRTVLYEGEYRMAGVKKKVIVDATGRPVN